MGSLTIVDLDAPQVYHRFDLAPRLWRESESVRWEFDSIQDAARSPGTWMGGGPRTIETELLLVGTVPQVDAAQRFLRRARMPRRYDRYQAYTATIQETGAAALRRQNSPFAEDAPTEVGPDFTAPSPITSLSDSWAQREFFRIGVESGPQETVTYERTYKRRLEQPDLTPPRLALIRGSRPGIFRCFISGFEARDLMVDEGAPLQVAVRIIFTELVSSEDDYVYSRFWGAPAATRKLLRVEAAARPSGGGRRYVRKTKAE